VACVLSVLLTHADPEVADVRLADFGASQAYPHSLAGAGGVEPCPPEVIPVGSSMVRPWAWVAPTGQWVPPGVLKQVVVKPLVRNDHPGGPRRRPCPCLALYPRQTVVITNALALLALALCIH
jgi:hypothetical protein